MWHCWSYIPALFWTFKRLACRKPPLTSRFHWGTGNLWFAYCSSKSAAVFGWGSLEFTYWKQLSSFFLCFSRLMITWNYKSHQVSTTGVLYVIYQILYDIYIYHIYIIYIQLPKMFLLHYWVGVCWGDIQVHGGGGWFYFVIQVNYETYWWYSSTDARRCCLNGIREILSTFYEFRGWWNPLNNLSWRCVCMCARVKSMETTKELHLIGLNYWIEGYYFWRFLEVFFGILRKTYWYILQLTWIWIIWLLDSMAFAKDANLDLPERKARKMGGAKTCEYQGRMVKLEIDCWDDLLSKQVWFLYCFLLFFFGGFPAISKSVCWEFIYRQPHEQAVEEVKMPSVQAQSFRKG